jgi:hypothetical protein
MMSPTALRILIALFFIAHGLMHYSLTTVPLPKPGELHTPFWPSWWRSAVDPAWPASRLGLTPAAARFLGCALWLAATVGFALAGLGLLGLPGLNLVWQGAVLFASAASLVLLVLFWHPWLVMGVVLSLGAAVAIWQQWPAWLYA